MNTTTAPDRGTASSPPRVTTTDPVPDETLQSLRKRNLVAAALHGVQAVVMLAIADLGFTLSVAELFGNGPPAPGIDPARLSEYFAVPIAWGTAGFLILSSVFHLLAATVARSFYESDLQRGMNRLRWVEYSLSSTLMVLLIAMLSAVQDVAALIAIAGANVSMILFGWLMETTNEHRRASPDWAPFWFGTIAGAVPWIAISVYLFAAPEIPGFVLGIFASLFVFFNCFAINQWLQYRGNGRWADTAHVERVYIWLSLTAKSALAWQVFGGTLAG